MHRTASELPDGMPVMNLARTLCKEVMALETEAASGHRAYVQVVREPDAGCQKAAVWGG